MKKYVSPKWELHRLAALAVLTASGDPDEWETDVIPPEEEEDSTADDA